MESVNRTQHHPGRAGSRPASLPAAQMPAGGRRVQGKQTTSKLLAATMLIISTTSADPNKLTEISVEKAESIVANQNRTPAYRSTLHVNGLKSLTPKVAAILAKQKGALQLNGLETITPEAAAKLANHASHDTNPNSNGIPLQLNGLKKISQQAGDAFARHTGRMELKSLTELNSLTLARKLAAQKKELYLDGLLSLSPEVAAILATNRGTFEDRSRPGVVFRRRDRAASVLRFTNLASISLDSAKALSKHSGVLVLNGLETISPDVAAALAKRDGGTLVLNGLLELSPETAKLLATYDGEIALKALKELSVECAEALSRHKHKLYLNGSTRISPEALKFIRKHPNVRLVRPIQPLSTQQKAAHMGRCHLESALLSNRNVFAFTTFRHLDSLPFAMI